MKFTMYSSALTFAALAYVFIESIDKYSVTYRVLKNTCTINISTIIITTNKGQPKNVQLRRSLGHLLHINPKNIEIAKVSIIYHAWRFLVDDDNEKHLVA